MKITDFTVRRLAQLVNDRDPAAVSALLVLTLGEKYQEASTQEMLDELDELDQRLVGYLAETGN